MMDWIVWIVLAAAGVGAVVSLVIATINLMDLP